MHPPPSHHPPAQPNTPPQVVNADVPRRHFLPVALGSAAVTQQLSAVAAALAVAAHLRGGGVTARTVLALSAAMLVLGYGVCCLLGGHVLGGSLVRRGGALRQLPVGRALSPPQRELRLSLFCFVLQL
jgi:hypothetical protein